MDGKDEDSAAPNSVVLCNLWIVPRDFRPFRDARPNRTEMGNLMIAGPNLRNGIPQEPRFSTAGETGLVNHSVPLSEES